MSNITKVLRNLHNGQRFPASNPDELVEYFAANCRGKSDEREQALKDVRQMATRGHAYGRFHYEGGGKYVYTKKAPESRSRQRVRLDKRVLILEAA